MNATTTKTYVRPAMNILIDHEIGAAYEICLDFIWDYRIGCKNMIEESEAVAQFRKDMDVLRKKMSILMPEWAVLYQNRTMFEDCLLADMKDQHAFYEEGLVHFALSLAERTEEADRELGLA